MDVNEANEIVLRDGRCTNLTVEEAEALGSAEGFLDALDQVRATGVREALKKALKGTRHSYDCPELKSGMPCNCGFHETISIGSKALANLDAVLGEE